MTQLGDIPSNARIPFPTGGIVMWAGDIAPDGFRICNGIILPWSADPALGAVLGSKYGGDGSTSYGLPDFRRRIPLGKAAAGTGNAVGQTGGSFDHQHDKGTLVGAAHDHADGSLLIPSHGHGHNFSVGGHGHGLPLGSSKSGNTSSGVSQQGGVDGAGAGVGGGIGGSGDTDVTGRTASATPAVAGGLVGAANPPYAVLNYLIGQSTIALGDLPATRDLRAEVAAFLTGMILPTARRKSQVGTGWLPCDGTLRRQADFPALFALIGHRFNGGVSPGNDGSGFPQFRLPNLTRLFPIGLDTGLAATDTIGKTGGAWDHTHTDGTLAMAAHSHAAGTLASADHGHGHSLYMADHGHGIYVPSIKLDWNQNPQYVHSHGFAYGSGNIGLPGGVSNRGAIGLGGSTDPGGDNDVTGATAAQNPPHYFLNFKVKT